MWGKSKAVGGFVLLASLPAERSDHSGTYLQPSAAVDCSSQLYSRSKEPAGTPAVEKLGFICRGGLWGALDSNLVLWLL
jgi:hypothetical protein